MDFVSKQQAYEATRKWLLEQAVRWHEPRVEDIARNMAMDGDRSRDPELYKRFLDEITADPISPADALDAAAQFIANTVGVKGKPEAERVLEAAKTTADDPAKGDPELWNHWIELLSRV